MQSQGSCTRCILVSNVYKRRNMDQGSRVLCQAIRNLFLIGRICLNRNPDVVLVSTLDAPRRNSTAADSADMVLLVVFVALTSMIHWTTERQQEVVQQLKPTNRSRIRPEDSPSARTAFRDQLG